VDRGGTALGKERFTRSFEEPAMLSGRRIGVLMGGMSSERELSLKTGEVVHEALCQRGYEAIKIFVDHDLDLALRAERIEVAFLALHGRYGEDGCVQGLLELLGIPYTGSSVLASALAMDKLKAKELFRLHNLPTPAYYVHHRGDGDPADALGDPPNAVAQHGGFGFPAIVKPRSEGSSLGVSRVDDEDELGMAVEDALRYGDDVLVERCIEGVELHVGLLEDRALGAIEIGRPAGILDMATRRGRSASHHVPPRIGNERLRGALTLAERAAAALGCSGLVEVDILLSERGNEYVLEVDTLPTLTPHSLVARIAETAGVCFEELVEQVLLEARLHSRGRAERRLRPDTSPAGLARAEPH
jgi:D-alanine-D-alanine ligase